MFTWWMFDVFFNIFLTPGFIWSWNFSLPRCRTAQPFGLRGVQGWKGGWLVGWLWMLPRFLCWFQWVIQEWSRTWLLVCKVADALGEETRSRQKDQKVRWSVGSCRLVQDLLGVLTIGRFGGGRSVYRRKIEKGGSMDKSKGTLFGWWYTSSLFSREFLHTRHRSSMFYVHMLFDRCDDDDDFQKWTKVWTRCCVTTAAYVKLRQWHVASIMGTFLAFWCQTH